MGRKKKAKDEGGGEGWLIIFSDLMTLLLTFFVLLLSMSKLDERRIRNYLTPTTRDSAIGVGLLNPTSKTDAEEYVHPGPMTAKDPRDLEAVREFIWENKDEDVNLLSNRDIAIISIGEATLFDPGSAIISYQGIKILDRLIPQIQNLQHPMLIAGHTSNVRDESETKYVDSRIIVDEISISPSWRLSIERAMAVYEYFKNSRALAGINILNEGFGEYRPKVSNNTPIGRKENRRVEVVLDRRNTGKIVRAPGEVRDKDKDKDKGEDVYEFKDFRFRLETTPPGSSELKIPVVPPESSELKIPIAPSAPSLDNPRREE